MLSNNRPREGNDIDLLLCRHKTPFTARTEGPSVKNISSHQAPALVHNATITLFYP